MSEQTFNDGRVVVKYGEGTEGINTTKYRPDWEIAANAFMDNVLNALPFRTETTKSATATIDKVVTITEAETVSQGNPSTRIPRSSGGSRSIPIQPWVTNGVVQLRSLKLLKSRPITEMS